MEKPRKGTGLTRAIAKGASRITSRAKANEQRRFRRYAMNFPCLVKPRGARLPAVLPELQAETKDVSSGGLFFVGAANWEVGTAIECELHLPLRAFSGRQVAIRCRGRVARLVPQQDGSVGIGATIENYDFSRL